MRENHANPTPKIGWRARDKQARIPGLVTRPETLNKLEGGDGSHPGVLRVGQWAGRCRMWVPFESRIPRSESRPEYAPRPLTSSFRGFYATSQGN